MRYTQTDQGFLLASDLCVDFFGSIPSRGETVTFDGHEYRCTGSCGDMVEFEAR